MQNKIFDYIFRVYKLLGKKFEIDTLFYYFEDTLLSIYFSNFLKLNRKCASNWNLRFL